MFKAASVNANAIERERGPDAAKAWMAEQSAVIVRSQVGAGAAENAPAGTINAFASQLVDDYETGSPGLSEQSEPAAIASESDSFQVEDAAQKVEAVQAAIDSGESFSFAIDLDFDVQQNQLYTSTQTQDDGSEQVMLFNASEIRVGEDRANVEVEIGYDASGDGFKPVWVQVPDFGAQLEPQLQQKESAAGQPEAAVPSPEPEAISDSDVESAPQPGQEEEAPFDYADTLKSLRATAARLPSAQRETLLKAVEQAEQIGQQHEAPAQQQPAQAPEPVPASELVTSAIAQNSPYLDAQLTQPEADADDGKPVPSVDKFRDWYRAARALGKDNQLGRFRPLVSWPKRRRLASVSDKDAGQMASDLAEFKEQRKQQGIAQQMISDARSFVTNLDSLGLVERDESGTGVVDGKYLYRPGKFQEWRNWRSQSEDGWQVRCQ